MTYDRITVLFPQNSESSRNQHIYLHPKNKQNDKTGNCKIIKCAEKAIM